jgi:hypothetical protein
MAIPSKPILSAPPVVVPEVPEVAAPIPTGFDASRLVAAERSQSMYPKQSSLCGPMYWEISNNEDGTLTANNSSINVSFTGTKAEFNKFLKGE